MNLGRLTLSLAAAAAAGCVAPGHRAPSPAAVASAENCVVADTSAATRDTIYAVGVSPNTGYLGSAGCAAAATAPVVVDELLPPGADLREVLDRGIPASRLPRPDVIVTRDQNTISYAASSRDYFTVVLPYDRTYALASADSAAALLSQAERDALARDAVRADVRGAVEPFTWLASADCTLPLVPSTGLPRPIVAYPAGDAIARQLAERIVALAAAQPRPAWISASESLRVAAMPADSIGVSITSGSAAAAVVVLHRDPHVHCGTTDAPLAWHTVPLVDSRAHAIVRRGSGAAFVINDDGSLRFVRRKIP